MDTPAAKLHAPKLTMPPTPLSERAKPSQVEKLPSANAMPSSPTPELHTPRERRSISNRFWDKNASRSTDGTPGVDLASDSSDPDDDSEAARLKKHANLASKIKRLLVLETGPVRLKTLETNATVREYAALVDAFAKKPKTKKKRVQRTDALLAFLQEHAQVVELYNQYAKIDHTLRKDRVLPTFAVLEEDEDGDTEKRKESHKDHDSDVRRAPAKHALNGEEDSDVEGIVTQTVKHGEDFDEPSVFNTRGLTAQSIVSGKSSVEAEKNQRRFLLHRRDERLTKEADGARGERSTREEEVTPTRPSKKRKLA